MEQYFRYYFNESKETLAERLHSELNPFGINVMKKSGGIIIAESDKIIYMLGDGKNLSWWQFYSEMESVFHFKAETVFYTPDMYTLEKLTKGRAFADELDKQKIPFYLLAHTNHNTQVLIRGLTLEHEGIINPKCNTYGVGDLALGMIKGLNHKEHVFAVDYQRDSYRKQ